MSLDTCQHKIICTDIILSLVDYSVVLDFGLDFQTCVISKKTADVRFVTRTIQSIEKWACPY